MSASALSGPKTKSQPITGAWGLATPGDQSWRAGAIGLLSVRFVQGFVYWGGGSRRFIYAPSKLDPDATHWMANKFQSAMPGALLGTDQIIAYLLHHFWLLYPAVILFSAAELVAGVLLMTGLFTRVAALLSVGFSVLLMLMFGWQGATCIDEWTMAAGSLAMGATLMLTGSGAYSIDNLLLARYPSLQRRGWFRWFAGALPLPLGEAGFRNLAFAVLGAVVLFNVATYDQYRGSVFGPFHEGPVSPTRHHYALSNATIQPDGAVRFHAYLDGGTAAAESHIVEATLIGPHGETLRRWDMDMLSQLPEGAIVNDFAYNRFVAGPYGLVSEVGAMATIALPALGAAPVDGDLALVLTTVSGSRFRVGVGRG